MSDLLKDKKIVIIGAGLVGTLLGIYLARRGYLVEIFERHFDPLEDRHHPSKTNTFKGTSINLALSARGIRALKELGIDTHVLKLCVPMYGRITHSKKGELYFQSYGLEERSEAIYSVPRGLLDKTLLELALKEENIKIYFDSKLETLDPENKKLFFRTKKSLKYLESSYDVLFGTDGARSYVRKSLEERGLVQTEIKTSLLGYREIPISFFKKSKEFSKPKLFNALHIWPRKNFMLIALPNLGDFFTGTLFLPLKGEGRSFESIRSPSQLKKFFKEEFFDISDHVIDLEESFFSPHRGVLLSIQTWPWFFEDQILIMGDGAHAMLPFFGQGMNASFEDVRMFIKMLDIENQKIAQSESTQDKGGRNYLKNLFKNFSNSRYPQILALSQMTEENDLEMREKMSDSNFLIKKKLELLLEKSFPDKFKSRYGLVSFTHTPYKEALERGKIQDEILDELLMDKKDLQKIDLKKAKKLLLKHFVGKCLQS